MNGPEYKCVPVPRRPKKARGHKTPADAMAAAMEAIINAEAAQGWEYLRTDLVPMEARHGLFGAVHESHQAVMIFRRAPRTASTAAAAPEVAIPPLGAARID
jgi:hypothetical protein